MNAPQQSAPSQALFLTWIKHRRTRAICERLGLSLEEIVSGKRGIGRYLELARKTIALLRRRQPAVLIVQTPSQVLGMLTLVLRPIFAYRLILDAHNEAVEPYLHPSWPVRVATRYLLHRADRVIVTNAQLAEIVRATKGVPIVLPDALPTPPAVSSSRTEPYFRIAVISTYADDEPLSAIVEAAKIVGEDVRFYITGNADKCPEAIRECLPPNVRLTGFLSDQAYWELIASADAVMDLTEMDNCLVCGAYEAVAVGKPLLLTDSAATRELFQGFGELTANRPKDIAAAIQRLRSRLPEMLAAMSTRRSEYDARWKHQAQALIEAIREPLSRRTRQRGTRSLS